MSDTPTEANQEEIEAVAIAFARLEADQMGTRNYEPSSLNRRDAQAAIAAIDDYRAKHSIIPSYLEVCDAYDIRDAIQIGERLFRFKDKDTTK